MSEPVFDIAVQRNITYLSNISLIDIQTELYEKNYLEGIVNIFLDIEEKNKSFDYMSELMVWEEIEPIDILGINLDIELQAFSKIYYL